jgi:hypothetical protein
VRGEIKDADGRTISVSRYIGGFAGAPKATAKIEIDGKLDDADWSRAPVQQINTEPQYNTFKKPTSKWKGVDDLSARVRYLWDDQYLYIAAEVTDDIFNNTKSDGGIWEGDSVQLLIDPARDSAQKPGKWDYVVALGTLGPQAWCALSADAGVPSGEAKDVRIAIQKGSAGSLTYEMAIPWSRLAPFKPAIGQNLGLALGLNEDDGHGRAALMGWFGNVHTKQLDSVGDIVLGR